MFFKCAKKASAAPDVPAQTRIGDPFAVIPIRPEYVEMRTDARGIVHLRASVKPTGLTGKIVDLVGYDYTRKLELDEYGSYYLQLVDGRTTLHTIVTKMAKKLGIGREEAERNVVLFTKKLMTMDMLALEIPDNAPTRRSHEQ